jgi:hypothetical protein
LRQIFHAAFQISNYFGLIHLTITWVGKGCGRLCQKFTGFAVCCGKSTICCSGVLYTYPCSDVVALILRQACQSGNILIAMTAVCGVIGGEFRTKYSNLHYRIFAFWDKEESIETLVIATHGIIKKTDKVPKKEIEKARAIMQVYFEQKIKK